jgi:HD-GYP domain-containing protein (c-di-GMP phosphodiesterase class II)
VLVVDKKVMAAIKAGKQKSSVIFKDAVDSVKNMVQAVQSDKFYNMRKMNTVVQNMVDNVLENRSAFLGLTNIKMYDEYTFAHSVNVSILAVSLGTFLSFEKSQIAALGVAGLMHDIGKVHVPNEIINKPGKLTAEEWEAVKRHPIEGALLLAGQPGISKMAMVAAFEHHQRGDGQGYPPVDGEHHQHPFSQIISLADAYDAITAARVYYNSQTPPDEAVRILLKKRGAPFNPYLVNIFVKMIGLFPVGTVVKLNTGETGLVMQQTSDLMRPRVLILDRFDGSEKENGLMVSLLETVNAQYKRTIAGTIDPFTANLDLKKYFD